MVSEPNSNGSSLNPLTEESTKEAAAMSEITYDELDDALGRFQKALENNLNDYYERAWLRGGAQNHLVYDSEGVFFAFVPPELYRSEPVRELEFDTETFNAITDAHQNQAAIWKFDVDRPTGYADALTHDYFPYFIRYPEHWRAALYHARLSMMYLLQHGMTPTEALDYWALDTGPGSLTSNQNVDRWHASRGVDREAVYKTRRQAKDKLGDDESRPYYEEQNIEIGDLE
ncbi:hypothetical protein SAMN04515672_0187 [Natronorubrum texcoconense]|uniref:DUF8048 domain-containing protein n=2 Tax=Natronorubrum texcoconense TaxID=1095776 RepID=A0A1G9HBV3_9EURY|nr:hypothetical protein SAMN04515672_0187 [Natronorubrum texcoconense]